MTRLVLLILLLTVVYSWEEFKYVLVVIWSKFSKQSIIYPPRLGETGQKNSETDVLVSDIVLVATVPLNLSYLILGPGSLTLKLLAVLAEFLVLGLVLKGIEEYQWRRRFTSHYEGMDNVIATIFSLVGLVSPSWKFAARTVRTTGHTGKYLLVLALPLCSGIALSIVAHRLGPEEFQSRLDPLIAVATLGLVLNVTIEILEHMLKSNKLHLTSLMRVVLGIVIIFVLTRT